MYAIHLRSSGSWMCSAIWAGPAPSIRAASIMSSLMLLSAPYMTTIQPPAPVQNAMMAKMTGRWPGAITLLNDWKPNNLSKAPTGLAFGSSTNSHSSTLDAPASAPGR